MKKSRICLLAGAGAVMIGVTGVSVYAHQSRNEQSTETAYKETTVEKGNLTVGVTESGSVSIGTLSQDIDLADSTSSSSSSAQQSSGGNMSGAGSQSSSTSDSSASLEVEEVYVTVGQKVAEGDALLKLTEESLEKYRKQLESAVTTASAELSEAKLTVAKQKLSANYSYHLSVAEGSVAEQEYQATVKQLQEAVEDAQEAVDESAALLTYYQEQIDAGIDLSASLEKEQKKYDTLATKLKSAQSACTTKSIEAEKKYQEAVFSSQNADSQYSLEVSMLDSNTEDAQETLEDAQEALAEFDALAGDGTLYAAYSGTIMSVGYEAGDELSESKNIVTFADAKDVTVTVSVSEEDVAQIAVGDTVEIKLTAYEDEVFEGWVTDIDTSVSSGSSTVSYNVTAAFSGNTDGVYADMTGNVTFIQKQVTDVLYVSNKAVVNDGTIAYVKRKENDGTIREVYVTTGFSDGVNVEIQSGLEEGDTVLIESKVTE